MPKYQVFISHSTKADPEAAKVLEALAKRLQESPERYGVLIDSELYYGDDWRSTINAWLGACDIAILLISPDALGSVYCQYEWSVLSYRRRQTENLFLVLPIYFRVKRENIAGKPHQLTEIDDITVTSTQEADLDAAWAKIKAILDEARPADRPAATQAGYIADTLKDLVKNSQAIVRAATTVDLQLGTWDPYQDLWLNFAFKLMGVGLRRATIALLELPGITKHSSELSELLDLISCSWVDGGSAGRIRSRAKGNTVERGVAVNAEDAVMAHIYILSASERRPDDIWNHAQVHNAFADHQGLRDRVLNALAAHFKIDPVNPDKVRQKLERLEGFQQPVLVTLQADGIDEVLLQSLREDFKSVTFFLLSGGTNLPEALRTMVESLEPPLPAGFEERFLKDYEDAKDVTGCS